MYNTNLMRMTSSIYIRTNRVQRASLTSTCTVLCIHVQTGSSQMIFFSTKDTDLELCQTLKSVTTSLCFLKDADISPFFTLQPYTCTCIRTKPTEACTAYVCNVGLGARVCLNSHSAVLATCSDLLHVQVTTIR